MKKIVLLGLVKRILSLSSFTVVKVLAVCRHTYLKTLTLRLLRPAMSQWRIKFCIRLTYIFLIKYTMLYLQIAVWISTSFCVTGMKKCEILAKGSLYDLFFQCIHKFCVSQRGYRRNEIGKQHKTVHKKPPWLQDKDIHIFFSPHSLILFCRFSPPDPGFRFMTWVLPVNFSHLVFI